MAVFYATFTTLSINSVKLRSYFACANLFLERIQNKKERMTQRQTEGKEGLEVREWGEVKQMEEERWRRKETERGDGKWCGPWLLLKARIGPGKEG